MVQRRKALPQLPAKLDPQTRQYLSALQEMIETGEGTRGDPLDTKLTFRDLIKSGVARLKGQIGPGGVTGDQLEPGGVPDMATPPAPQGAEFIAVFDAITALWNDPYAAYSNHAYTEVWRAEGVNAQFDGAVLIGVSDGSMYSDYSVEGGTDYTYWIRFISTSDVRGPWHKPGGTSLQALVSIERMLEELSGKIDESVLAQSLSEQIDKIEINETAIRQEQDIRQSADSALASQISTVSAKANSNAAAIVTEQKARSDADSALASNITTVQSQLGSDIASVQQKATTNLSKINGLSAEYTLKLDVNGYVSGFGTYNDGKTSDFAVTADRFWIAPPNSTGKVKPFIVSGGNVYIDSAFIRDASIQEGKLGPISFGKIRDSSGQPVTTLRGKLKAQNIDVDSLQVTNANISGDLWSTNYSPGSAGWKIWRNGNAEFNAAEFRGKINFADLAIQGRPISERAPFSGSLAPGSGSSTGRINFYNNQPGQKFWSSWDEIGKYSKTFAVGGNTSNARVDVTAEFICRINWDKQNFIATHDGEYSGYTFFSVEVQAELQVKENGAWRTFARTGVRESGGYPTGEPSAFNIPINVSGTTGVFFGETPSATIEVRVIARTGSSGWLTAADRTADGTRASVTSGSASGSIYFYRI